MSLLITNTLKSQISKILWVTVGWTIISVYVVLFVYGHMIDLERDVSDLDLSLYIKGSLMTGILAGITGGSLVVFLWERWLRSKNYGSSLWSMLWTYTVLYFMVGIPTGLFMESSELGLPFYHSRVWQKVLSDFVSITELSDYVFWLLVVTGTLIVLLVNDKYGPGVFRIFYWESTFIQKGKSGFSCSLICVHPLPLQKN